MVGTELRSLTELCPGGRVAIYRDVFLEETTGLPQHQMWLDGFNFGGNGSQIVVHKSIYLLEQILLSPENHSLVFEWQVRGPYSGLLANELGEVRTLRIAGYRDRLPQCDAQSMENVRDAIWRIINAVDACPKDIKPPQWLELLASLAFTGAESLQDALAIVSKQHLPYLATGHAEAAWQVLEDNGWRTPNPTDSEGDHDEIEYGGDKDDVDPDEDACTAF